MPIPKSMLGRYEYVDWSANHNKFWHIIHDQSTNTYRATWGRIGNRSPDPIEYPEKKAYTKISEKIKKGYKKVEGSVEVVGALSINFINSLCKG